MAVGAYGLSFGAAAVTAGLSTWQACVLSLLLGTRNTLYGVRLSSLLPTRGARRLLAAQLTIDESTGMATAAPPALSATAFWATGGSVYVLWNLATLAGAVGAARLGDPAALGLDAAVPAAFLALLAPQLRSAGLRSAAAAGALVAAAAVPFTPPGVPVLLAGLVVVPALARR